MPLAGCCDDLFENHSENNLSHTYRMIPLSTPLFSRWSIPFIFFCISVLSLFFGILQGTIWPDPPDFAETCVPGGCFVYFIQYCFICRPSVSQRSTVSEDAGIEPRTVATFALAGGPWPVFVVSTYVFIVGLAASYTVLRSGSPQRSLYNSQNTERGLGRCTA